MTLLERALRELRDVLTDARFGLALPAADQARRQVAHLTAQLDDYLLPRLARLDAPLLVVVGGSTGAGKSTLVNSILRAPVSRAGVLRPTTRSPVLVCHPDDIGWFGETHLLPGLPRASAAAEGPRLQVVTAPELPPGVAFLDAPDIDSVVDANRELAGQLLAAADLWLFLTTSSRYADAVPWDVLRDAAERGAAVALVLDRVPVEGRDVVAEHLRQMLFDQGFGESPLFVVAEQPLDRQGLLPDKAVAPIQEWFGSLARDVPQRDAVVRQTLSGALSSLPPRIDAIAVQADAQRDAAAFLRATAQNSYTEALTRVEEGLRDGVLLRGEVLGRWQELISAGELTRALEARAGKMRDQLRAAITGRPLPGEKFRAALSSGAAALITATAGDAAEQASAQWANHPAGEALLTAPDECRASSLAYHRPSADISERVDALIADWQRDVWERVRHDAADKRSVARLTSYTVNATGLLVMIGVFASTAFIPAEPEAAGATVTSQKLLDAIFEDQAVRQLAERAQQDLLERVRLLLDEERQRYTDLLHQAWVDPTTSDRLRQAGGEVEHARLLAAMVPSRDVLAAIPLPDEGPEFSEEPIGGSKRPSGAPADDAGEPPESGVPSETGTEQVDPEPADVEGAEPEQSEPDPVTKPDAVTDSDARTESDPAAADDDHDGDEAEATPADPDPERAAEAPRGEGPEQPGGEAESNPGGEESAEETDLDGGEEKPGENAQRELPPERAPAVVDGAAGSSPGADGTTADVAVPGVADGPQDDTRQQKSNGPSGSKREARQRRKPARRKK